jgi:hypothetical protein
MRCAKSTGGKCLASKRSGSGGCNSSGIPSLPPPTKQTHHAEAGGEEWQSGGQRSVFHQRIKSSDARYLQRGPCQKIDSSRLGYYLSALPARECHKLWKAAQFGDCIGLLHRLAAVRATRRWLIIAHVTHLAEYGPRSIDPHQPNLRAGF